MMESFFTFLQTHRSGILLLFACIAGIAFLIQWFAWIFRVGRFRVTDTKSRGVITRTDLRYIFSDAAVKIINDFRHLLALVIVLIFAFALGYALIKAASIETNADSPSVVDNMKEALQVVVATLGGLVGSIIGYYFGESSVTKVAETRPPAAIPDKTPIKETPLPIEE